MGIIYLSKQNLVCDNNPVVIVKKCRALNDSVKLFSSFRISNLAVDAHRKCSQKKKNTFEKNFDFAERYAKTTTTTK
jgi:hypothetical protein